MLWVSLEFLRTPNSGNGVSLTILPAHMTLFLLLVCCVQPEYQGWCIVLLQLVVTCSVNIPGSSAFFWRETENRERVWMGGKIERRLEGEGEGLTVFGIYCISDEWIKRKKYVCLWKKNFLKVFRPHAAERPCCSEVAIYHGPVAFS